MGLVDGIAQIPLVFFCLTNTTNPDTQGRMIGSHFGIGWWDCSIKYYVLRWVVSTLESWVLNFFCGHGFFVVLAKLLIFHHFRAVFSVH